MCVFSFHLRLPLMIFALLPFYQAFASDLENQTIDSNEQKQKEASIPFPSPYDSIYGHYDSGAYVLSYKENVGLSAFREEVVKKINVNRSAAANSGLHSLNQITTMNQVPEEEVFQAALAVLKEETASLRTQKSSAKSSLLASSAGQQRMFMDLPTPSGTTAALAGIELMLDDLMNRANSTISSALFSMRSHVAASEADLNVIFKNRMDEAFDKLSAEDQKILTNAQVLAAQAEQSIKEVEQNGFDAASDLVCQTTAGFANYSLGLPIGRLLPPDLLCLKELHIRDVGPQHEQLLTFRGVHLQPKEEYPSAKIQVAGQEYVTPTGGGDSILQVPLPGGINGSPNDTSSRGDRIAQVEFSWHKADRARRWLFTLQPYLVTTLDVTMTPTIKGPVRKAKTQDCYIHADGGSIGSREETATCTILADDGWTVESCTESSPTTQNGDAEFRNKLASVGACQWELHAKSKGWWGAGAWIGFHGYANLIKTIEIRGKPFQVRKVLNQNDTSAVFTYPADSLIPGEFSIQAGGWSWEIDYYDNTDRQHILTNTVPSAPNIGIGALDAGNGILTYTVLGH